MTFKRKSYKAKPKAWKKASYKKKSAYKKKSSYARVSAKKTSKSAFQLTRALGIPLKTNSLQPFNIEKSFVLGYLYNHTTALVGSRSMEITSQISSSQGWYVQADTPGAFPDTVDKAFMLLPAVDHITEIGSITGTWREFRVNYFDVEIRMLVGGGSGSGAMTNENTVATGYDTAPVSYAAPITSYYVATPKNSADSFNMSSSLFPNEEDMRQRGAKEIPFPMGAVRKFRFKPHVFQQVASDLATSGAPQIAINGWMDANAGQAGAGLNWPSAYFYFKNLALSDGKDGTSCRVEFRVAVNLSVRGLITA